MHKGYLFYTRSYSNYAIGKLEYSSINFAQIVGYINFIYANCQNQK